MKSKVQSWFDLWKVRLLSMIAIVIAVAGTMFHVMGVVALGFFWACTAALPKQFGYLKPMIAAGIVDTNTFLNDAKIIYGSLVNQVSTQAILINLFGDGSKFGKPINNIGIKGYTFAARMGPNYNMGYRLEGTTGVGTAGNQPLQQATVFLKYAYVPLAITGQAENLTKGEGRAFMQAKALEAKWDMEDIVKHVNVVIGGAQRGGALATVSASGAGTFTCSVAGGLPGALYLKPGMPIDGGPVGGGANSVTGQTILTVNYTTNVCTIAAGTVTVGHVIYLSGESTTAPNFPLTAECLSSLLSDTQAIQGIDPTVAGNIAWKSLLSNAAGADLSPVNMTTMKMFAKTRGGHMPDMFLFPSSQIAKYVAISLTDIKFDIAGSTSSVAKKAIDLGFSVFNFAGIPMIEDPDLLPDRFYVGNSDALKKFEAVPLSMADDEAGTWTRISGANGIADAVQGLLRWYHQLGVLQRSDWAVRYNLSVISDFLTNPAQLA